MPEQLLHTAVPSVVLSGGPMAVDRSNSHIRSEVVDLIPALRSFARRFHRTSTDVDDLVQETLLRALANIDKFQPGTNLKSWLFTIMRNTFCTKFGLAKREVIGLGEGISPQPSVQAPQEWSVRARELEKAFSELPAHYRQALDIVLIQGRATRLRHNVATARSGRSRAGSTVPASILPPSSEKISSPISARPSRKETPRDWPQG